MKHNRILILAAVALMATGLVTSCKSSGMAMTSRGQIFKINIYAPSTLAEGADANVDIVLSNRGVNNVNDILTDVQLPPQLIVLDQTADRGVTMARDPGSNTFHFTLGSLNPGEDSKIRFHVRTSFGTLTQTDSISVTSWQKDLPGDKLVRNTVIKLQR